MQPRGRPAPERACPILRFVVANQIMVRGQSRRPSERTTKYACCRSRKLRDSRATRSRLATTFSVSSRDCCWDWISRCTAARMNALQLENPLDFAAASSCRLKSASNLAERTTPRGLAKRSPLRPYAPAPGPRDAGRLLALGSDARSWSQAAAHAKHQVGENRALRARRCGRVHLPVRAPLPHRLRKVDQSQARNGQDRPTPGVRSTA